jgi:hypothetical protein
MITYVDAQREEAKLSAYLQTKDSVDEIRDQALKTASLYRKCIEQREIVQSAVAGASQAIRTAEERGASCVSTRVSAERDRKAAEAVHAKCSAADFIRAGDQYVVDAKRKLEKAKQQLREKRFVSARRTAEEAVAEFSQADDSFKKASKHCAALDEQKQKYEAKLASMEQCRREVVSKVQRYGKDISRVPVYQQPSCSDGLVDYTILCGTLSLQESAWEREELAARREHEEEELQRRIAEAAELARIAREAEEDRRQHSSYSSYTSSDRDDDEDTSSSGRDDEETTSSSSGGDG